MGAPPSRLHIVMSAIPVKQDRAKRAGRTLFNCKIDLSRRGPVPVRLRRRWYPTHPDARVRAWGGWYQPPRCGWRPCRFWPSLGTRRRQHSPELGSDPNDPSVVSQVSEVNSVNHPNHATPCSPPPQPRYPPHPRLHGVPGGHANSPSAMVPRTAGLAPPARSRPGGEHPRRAVPQILSLQIPASGEPRSPERRASSGRGRWRRRR